MKKRAFVSKKFQKLSQGCCKICGENNYPLLDVHRIKPELGYNYANTVILCNKCHRKHHTGLITIHSWFQSTKGRMLHWHEGNTEHFS